MDRAAAILLGTHRGPLSMQRVVGIVNDHVLPLMMGRMQILCAPDNTPIRWLYVDSQLCFASQQRKIIHGVNEVNERQHPWLEITPLSWKKNQP